MRLALTVSTTAADTSFYVRISVKNERYTYTLRHDITSLCFQLGAYEKNSAVTLNFCFDDYAFLLKKGECLQIDIAAADDNGYVPHTNKRGRYDLQVEVETAVHTVYLGRSCLYLPVEQ